MKAIKKIISCIIITSLSVSSAFTVQKNADAAASVNLATFSFSKSDGSAADKSLNDTYKTNADTGYSAKSGIFPSSKLFASVADPSKSDYRKLEWSGATSPYTYNNTSVSMPVMAASDKNTWGTTPYFLIRTSTKGYENITMSLILGGSKKGPKDYKIQYSTDNKVFSDVSGATLSISENKKMFPYSFTLSAAKDKTVLYIRIIASSTNTIEGGSFANAVTSGETAINNIVIKGSAISPSSTASTTTTPPKNSNGNSTTTEPDTGKSDSGQNTNNAVSDKKKTLSKPSLKSYKAGSSVVRGKAAKKSSITLTTGKKIYKAKASKKGTFKIKLSKKLKKGQVIKLYASKASYNNSKTKKYTVK